MPRTRFGKKASLELSVNFIVVMIISILLLGGGIFLLAQGSNAWEKEYERLQELHKSQIRAAMARSGDLVMAFPTTATAMQGDRVIFTVGINNLLGKDEKFYVYAKQSASSIGDNKLLFTRDAISVKNTAAGFTPVRVEISKEKSKVTYIVNICVFVGNPGTDCAQGLEGLYGDMQKVIINVK